MTRPVILKYHQATFDLLGIAPVACEAALKAIETSRGGGQENTPGIRLRVVFPCQLGRDTRNVLRRR